MPGNGKIEVNKRSLEEFFPRPMHQTMVKQPLTVSGYEGNVDVRVRVHGGGIGGQAGAIRHGVARALTEIDSSCAATSSGEASSPAMRASRSAARPG